MHTGESDGDIGAAMRAASDKSIGDFSVTPPSRRLVLVTGATGAVGQTLVDELLQQGFTVRVLTRQSTLPPTVYPGAVEIIRGDIEDSSLVRSAVSGCELVFHLAGLLHVDSPDEKTNLEYSRVNVSGTRNVVQSAARQRVRRLVLFSTIAVYGDDIAGPVDEDAVTSPSTEYARTKLEAEHVALAMSNSGGAPLTTVLRLAAVYGPHMKGNYAKMFSALRRRRFVPIGQGTNRRTLVYERDVARAAVAVAESSVAAGKIYNVTDGQTHTVAEIIAAMCAALARRPPLIHVPIAFARCAVLGMTAVGKVAGISLPIRPAALAKYLSDVWVSGDRIREEVGFVAQYDLRRGWAETARGLTVSGD